jgi:hypothetical protein
VEREISSGAMLGIVLLALAAVIGLGFGVFSIAKGIANEGTVNVQDSLGAVSLQMFLDYDQKIITGTQVVAALKGFEGKPYAILISSRAFMSNQAVATEHNATGTMVGTATPTWVGTTAGTDFINYNAQLASDSAGAKPARLMGASTNTRYPTVAPATVSGSPLITMNNGTYIARFGFATSGGEVSFDNATAGVFKSGNSEYVPSSTKFAANLIKDSSGSIMGITFKQL